MRQDKIHKLEYLFGLFANSTAILECAIIFPYVLQYTRDEYIRSIQEDKIYG